MAALLSKTFAAHFPGMVSHATEPIWGFGFACAKSLRPRGHASASAPASREGTPTSPASTRHASPKSSVSSSRQCGLEPHLSMFLAVCLGERKRAVPPQGGGVLLSSLKNAGVAAPHT